MKTNLIFITACFISSKYATAQPSLTQGNYAPAAGEVRTQFLTDNSLKPGASGANKTWIYDPIVIDTIPTVFTYMSADSSPYSSFFPLVILQALTE